MAETFIERSTLALQELLQGQLPGVSAMNSLDQMKMFLQQCCSDPASVTCIACIVLVLCFNPREQL